MEISVDNIAGGALMGKSIEAAKALLTDEITSNNYNWLVREQIQRKEVANMMLMQ